MVERRLELGLQVVIVILLALILIRMPSDNGTLSSIDNRVGEICSTLKGNHVFCNQH